MAPTKKILVVDDEKDMTSYISTLFADNGYEVQTAENGAAAQEKIKTWTPDLITLDVVMPDKTGVKFYRELKGDQKTAGIPVIFITGVTPDFEKFISNRLSAPAPEGYMAKPFEPEALLALVEKLLAQKVKTGAA